MNRSANERLSIGLCGGHRTGKTTLSHALAERLDIEFVQTSTSQVFAEHGLDPSQQLDFDQRLWIQQKVLEAAMSIWENAPANFITDRTPIDFMAYTLGDIQGNTTVNDAALTDYLNACFKAANRFFTHLHIIQPGIPLVYEPGKAALNQAYIEHLNSLVLGLCHDERLAVAISVVPRKMLELPARLDHGVDSLTTQHRLQNPDA